MPPGGEMFRFYSAFRRKRTAYPGGMNASPTVKTQCVCKSSNNNLPFQREIIKRPGSGCCRAFGNYCSTLAMASWKSLVSVKISFL